MSATTTAQYMEEQIGVRLDEELSSDLQRYRDQHAFPPNKSDVVRRALREFLDRELAEE